MGDPAEHATWPPALVAIYQEQYATLVRLGFLLCGSREVAEEAVHDAFISVQARWEHVATSPGGYVRTAVVNAVHQRGRRDRTARQYLATERTEVAVVPPADRAEFADVLDRLSWPQRTAIVARYWLDLADGEIAEMLDCRPATVRSHLARGLAALRQELEDE